MTAQLFIGLALATSPQLPLPEQVDCWDLVQVLRQEQAAWNQKWSGWKRRGLKDSIGRF